jgi:hypothetical protein
VDLGKFDQPLVFAFAITFVVVGMVSILRWGAASLHWTGLSSLLHGGVM